MKKNVIIASLSLGLLALVGVLIIYLYLPYLEQQREEKRKEQQRVISEFQDLSYANKTMGNISLSRLDAQTITATLQTEMAPYLAKTLALQINGRTITYTVDEFQQKIYYKCSDGPTFNAGEEENLADYLVQKDKDLSVEEQYNMVQGTKEPTTINVTIQCECNKQKLTEIIRRFSRKYDVPPIEARITSSLKVTKEKAGSVLDTETMAKELSTYLDRQTTKNFSGSYQTTPIQPSWYASDLKKVNTLLAQHETSFKEGSSRAYNIKLAASRLNGVCLLPDESISFLDVLYNNSDHRSYKKSSAYLKGKVVQADGGGICQVSTTAYHAFLLAGIIPETRFPHSMPVNYAPLGLDAALSAGGKDLVIKNTLDAPILILARTRHGKLAVALQSYKGILKGFTYKPRALKQSELEATSYLDVYRNKKREKTIELSHDTYQAPSK